MSKVESSSALTKEERQKGVELIIRFLNDQTAEASELDLAAWPKEGAETAEFTTAVSTLLDKVEEITAAKKDGDPTKRRRSTRSRYEVSAKILLCNILAYPFALQKFRWRSSSSATEQFKTGNFDNPAGIKPTNLATVIEAAEALRWIRFVPAKDDILSVEAALGPFETRSKREKHPASRFQLCRAAPFLTDCGFIGFHPDSKFVLKGRPTEESAAKNSPVEPLFTPEEDAADQQLLAEYNAIIRDATIRDKAGGQRPHARPLRRYESAFGRFHGGFWQTMRKEDRRHLTIDGEATAELDFSAMFPRLLYHTQGHDFLDEDGKPGELYDMGEGLDKGHWKSLFMIALNTSSVGEGCTALHSRVSKTYGKQTDQWPSELQDLWKRRKELFDHLLKFHEPIAPKLFNKGVFTELTRKEAEITRCILQASVARLREEGIRFPVLPIHDSFIVPISGKDHLKGIMHSIYRDTVGFKPLIKEKNHKN